ncbi:MAG: ABC transporter substrate-binding protein [Deltaproteobacteria bacterium]|nr:ABC transporter substrate-binding protein [Deltaproteobacteria bacterium]
MIRRRTSQVLLISAAILILASRSARSQENVRVAYPSVSASTIMLMIASKEGYFKEEGLNVELLSIRGEIAIRIALAGEIDFFTNAGSALAAVARNVPLKILAVVQDKPGWDLIALPSIKSIAQLRGQTVAIMSPEGSLAVVTREILRKNGIDPTKDANLVVMGGDDVRLPALKGKAIQATLFNAAASIRAQKDGFTKLASASEYVSAIQGGIATTDERIKQQPAKIARFMRASLKGLSFFVSKKDASIKYMIDILKIKDRDMVASIYEEEAKITVRSAISEDKIIQPLIDDMKRTTKSTREMKVSDVFDFSFARKAGEELKASGWKP